MPAKLKLPTQMPTLSIFELRDRVRKLVEYLWRYRIFADTVYRLKVAKFQMLSMRNVSLSIAKVKYLRSWKFPPKCTPQLLRAEAKISKIGWISLEIQDLCWHGVPVESSKISNVIDAETFTSHFKSKMPAKLKLPTQMPTLSIFELKDRFRKLEI